MKKLLLLISILISSNSHGTIADLVSPVSDAKFRGYYLNIEKTMKKLKVTRLQAHEIQNQMRDILENLSRSYLRVNQKRFLKRALNKAVYRVVKQGKSEGKFKPMHFRRGEFIIVLDLDETLLSQWYRKGSKGKMTFSVEVADEVPDIENNLILQSPKAVQIRPGVEDFFASVANSKGFRGFVLFTAKEDRAAWAVLRRWKALHPKLFENVLGFYTRNYLKFQRGLKKPSKDLAMFDPSLKHVFLIDDNESRVVQKSLNYRIPKFNADIAIADPSPRIKFLNQNILGFIALIINNCSLQPNPINCLSREIGIVDAGEENINRYLKFLNNSIDSDFQIKQVIDEKIFEPEFFINNKLPLN